MTIWSLDIDNEYLDFEINALVQRRYKSHIQKLWKQFIKMFFCQKRFLYTNVGACGAIWYSYQNNMFRLFLNNFVEEAGKILSQRCTYKLKSFCTAGL